MDRTRLVCFLLSCGAGSMAAVAACSQAASSATASMPQDDASSDTGAEEDDSGAASDVGDSGVDAAPSCNGSPLHAYDETPGVLQRLYGDVPFQGQNDVFLIDMGSPATFAYTKSTALDGGPTIVADAGHASISCADVSILGYSGAVAETTPDNVVVRGTLGADLVSRGELLDLRISEQRFFWWPTPPAAPAGAVVLPAVFGQTPQNFAVVASGIQLDGKDVRLMLDTGSPHVLILSSTPRANETLVKTVDGVGNPVTIYTSTIQIGFLGGAAHAVAVDRVTPGTFPDLENLLTDLGGGISGLLGLAALGHDRIMISRDSLAFVP